VRRFDDLHFTASSDAFIQCSGCQALKWSVGLSENKKIKFDRQSRPKPQD
jgi:hypothetical protein